MILKRIIEALKGYFAPPPFDTDFIESPKPKRKRKTKKGGKRKPKAASLPKCDCDMCSTKEFYESSFHVS